MKLKLLTLLFLSVCGIASAQKKVKYNDKERDMLKTYFFNEGFNSPATKKVSTLIMKDGTVHKGYCNSVRTKKGQINEITFKDSISGNKQTYEATKIAEAYLFASGMEKFGKVSEKFSNYGMGKRNSVKKLTSSDEVYFENKTVALKNKKSEREFLMQLINPDFSSIIAVYHDPFASESGGFSVGGSPTFGGGVVKSYYVEKDGKIFWLPKKDFKERYEQLFGDNAQFMAKYPYNSINWDWLSALILEYTRMSVENE